MPKLKIKQENIFFCRWYTKARKAMSKNNSMSSIKNDDFMTSDFSNRDFHLGSPTLMRTFLPSTPSHNNGGEQRFSTRYKTIFSENVIPSAGLFLPPGH